jgi:hypothetical protein
MQRIMLRIPRKAMRNMLLFFYSWMRNCFYIFAMTYLSVVFFLLGRLFRDKELIAV